MGSTSRVYPFTSPYPGKIGFSTRMRQHTAAEAQTAAARMAAGGFGIAREDVPWVTVEPTTKGTYNWTIPDLQVRACALAGIELTPVITTAPQWANGSSDFYVPPTNDSDYADFVVAYLARYGPGGSFWTANPSLTAKPVVSVELWNEPFFGDPSLATGFFHATGSNGPTWPAGGPDPIKYASMCVAVGTAVRSAAPTVKVIISGEAYVSTPTPQSTLFLDAVLAAQSTLVSSNLFDGVAVHPYPAAKSYGPWIAVGLGSGTAQLIDPQGRFDRIAKTLSTLTTRSATGKELWVTELGWTTASVADGVTEAVQSEYLQGALRRLFRGFGAARVYVFTFEDELASAPSSTDETAGFNVVKFSTAGGPGSEKAALTMLRSLAAGGDDGVELYKDAVLADNPAFYTRLDGPGQVARDISLNKLSGSAVGTITRLQASAISDPADFSTLFDGSTGGILWPGHTAFNVTQGLTVEAWVKVTTAQNNAMVLRKSGQWWLYTSIFNTTQWGPNFSIVQGGVTKSVFIQTADALNVGVWAHIVGVYDGTNLLLYINGRLVRIAAQTGAVDVSANPVGLGYQGASAAQYHAGNLDEVAFYPYALSSRRIAEHYQSGVATLKP